MIGPLDYSWIAFPLQVIAVNRIAQSPLFKQAGENLPREATALYERGALRNGFYRGMAPAFALSVVSTHNQKRSMNEWQWAAA